MGFEPMHANIVQLECTALDQLGQSGKIVLTLYGVFDGAGLNTSISVSWTIALPLS